MRWIRILWNRMCPVYSSRCSSIQNFAEFTAVYLLLRWERCPWMTHCDWLWNYYKVILDRHSWCGQNSEVPTEQWDGVYPADRNPASLSNVIPSCTVPTCCPWLQSALLQPMSVPPHVTVMLNLNLEGILTCNIRH